ncbi:unnamed protein product [Staurois parvus]|uniref:Uncharacterized protein n=1 Tax=Staurois parvus TaxID=386267 RepID=A0ABN9CAK1_9NEOB|nr:unnamed protein product [Staurois parvus]
MASPLCEISDVCKDWTLVKNISSTQNRNTVLPLCGISDVYTDGSSLKNISALGTGIRLLPCVRSLMSDRNTASPPCEIFYAH